MYECINENAVQCVEHANSYGGCAKLDGEPGESCGECGQWVCDGVDSVRCDDPGVNGCGGCAQLDGDPGDACGTCGENEYECSGTDAVICIDPDDEFAEAADLGNFTDADNDAGDFYGRLYPGEDETDWFMAHVEDTATANMTPWVRLTSPAGASYRLCAYFDSEEMDGCLDGTPDTFNGLSGCCGNDVEFDVGGYFGSNSGGWVYIRIEYTQDSSSTCEPYHVTFGF
jgi:hypothetical protein